MDNFMVTESFYHYHPFLETSEKSHVTKTFYVDFSRVYTCVEHMVTESRGHYLS